MVAVDAVEFQPAPNQVRVKGFAFAMEEENVAVAQIVQNQRRHAVYAKHMVGGFVVDVKDASSLRKVVDTVEPMAEGSDVKPQIVPKGHKVEGIVSVTEEPAAARSRVASRMTEEEAFVPSMAVVNDAKSWGAIRPPGSEGNAANTARGPR